MKERPASVPWLALLLLLALLPTACLAAGDAQTQSLLEALDLGAWQAQAPELPLRELLERFSSGDFSIDLDGLRDAAVQSLLQEVRFSLPLLLRVCALSLLMSVLSRLRLSLVGEDVARVCELVLFLCATLPLAVDFMRLVAKGEACIGALNGIAQSVLPTMLALLAALGGGSTVTAMQPMVLGAGALSTSLLQNLLLPLVRMTAVLVLVSAMTGENRFSNLVACLRSLCHWALGACFTAFLGLLTVKGLAAGAVDSVAVRTAKYTVDNLVPVVGGLFKDSVDTLVGCALVVKNAIGLAGLLSLLLCLLSPAASVLTVLLGYRLCAALLQPLGENRLLGALNGFAATLSTLLLCMLVALAVFFVFVTVLMSSGIRL